MLMSNQNNQEMKISLETMKKGEKRKRTWGINSLCIWIVKKYYAKKLSICLVIT